METKTYLRKDGADELGEPLWRCARPCQDPSLDTTLSEDERLLSAIEGRFG